MSTEPNDLTNCCHECGSRDLVLVPGFADFHRVTSDCKPWPPGGVLAFCRRCGLTSTVPSPDWRMQADSIYRDYTIYHQAGGAEQSVFRTPMGAGHPRSAVIARALVQQAALPTRGRLLDIGCGNGAFLRACHAVVPNWSLCGSEVSDVHRGEIEALPGVERLHVGPLAEIPGEFDLISMIHVLEHIPAPGAFLRGLLPRLRPGGVVLLQVPDCLQNYFMLIVADHCSHFTLKTLGRVAATGGFEVQHAANDWVPKELSLLAVKTDSVAPPLPHSDGAESDLVTAGCDSLRRVLRQAIPFSARRGFGIFGTSIAATWLDAETAGRAKFFVDEDPSRAGRQHLGRPILTVASVPVAASVFVPLAPVLASQVVQRLGSVRPDIEIGSL